MANKKILVSFTYKKREQLILKDINLNIYCGDVITIIGPNGGGKTTLAKIITGIEKQYSGIVKLCKNIKIGYMPQNINFNPLIPITVKNFLLLACNLTNCYTKQAQTIITRNKIDIILNKQLHNLSGGELQRVMLSITLLKDPDLLVLDEPTKALDINGQNEFYSLMEEIKKNEHKTMVIISHDLHTVMRATDKVICLNKEICCSGIPEYVTKKTAYKKLFFTEQEEKIAYYKHKDEKND